MFDTAIGLIDKHLLLKYGKKLHYGMAVAVGAVVIFTLIENFTTIIVPYKNSILLAIFYGTAMAYADLYIVIGVMYQQSRFYRWLLTTRVFWA